MGVFFETLTRDLVAVLIVIVTYCVYYVRRRYHYWHRKGLPFLAPTFPYGNFKGPLLQRTSFADNTNALYKASDAPVVGIWTVFRPALLICDPEVVHNILIKEFSTFSTRGTYSNEKRDPLTGHLFALPTDKWRPLRQKLTPTFTSGKLKAMFQTLLDCSNSLDTFVGRAATVGATVEIRELLAQYTTNIIASVAFGVDVDCITDPDTEFRRAGRKIFSLSRMNGIRRAFNFIMPHLLKYTPVRAFDTTVESFIMSVVRQNLQVREQQKVTRKDFFQLLVQLRNTGIVQTDNEWKTKIADGDQAKHMSIEECAAQSFIFYIAGFEASSTTMSFALYELAKNAECQRRLQKEIDDAVKQNDDKITYQSVLDMTYLDWVVDETLRKYPPVPFLNRETVQPWTITNTNIVVGAGTSVVIPAMAFHNDPKYFPEPERFIPERFSPEQSAGKTFLDRPYMPFGEGPRNCIGLRMGKMQTKVGLITMLQKYNYELAGVTKQPIALNPGTVLLSPVGGINLKITERKV